MDWSIVQRVLPAFLTGALNTIIYCVSAFPLALLFGMLLALMCSSRFVWLRVPARTYIEVIRGTPMIAQLFIIYYAFGAIFANLGFPSLINSLTAGIASLAINYAAYEAEVFRAGFLSVDRGQTEAALSLGLTSGQNFFRILLPQAFPFMIPPFVNDFIYMLKDSAIVSVIAGTELTSVLTYWVSRNGSNPIPLYAMAIVLYLLLSLPTSYVARTFERRLRAAL
ncbi:glutamine ABC transporter permease [Reticulibacter mediterranei]|uniref:Glutamine ABC transporter permease n=1 Tax=Reticulibacter mediterranei TaxID=2778369 RepID=A0A8J3MZE3_9CHLR|nr:amino acid ABC transporter permease [Reticulibacter mediterranei]GHO91822.1 glutamine ABC transporter permease [Reticulibacter mediterranei]